MLASLIASASAGEEVLYWIEWVSLLIEVIAVIIIVVAIINALSRYVFRVILQPQEGDHYQRLKISLGKALLLGLEILVAADIIRTFLSWALVVEIEGHWPWQLPQTSSNDDANI